MQFLVKDMNTLACNMQSRLNQSFFFLVVVPPDVKCWTEGRMRAKVFKTMICSWLMYMCIILLSFLSIHVIIPPELWILSSECQILFYQCNPWHYKGLLPPRNHNAVIFRKSFMFWDDETIHKNHKKHIQIDHQQCIFSHF